MRKLFSFFAALTLSVGLWAETVSYLYPVYNTDGVATSGIKEWQSTTVDATEITSSSATLAAGWYVVKGTDVQTGTLTCQGAVHIILADGAKLTATGSADHPNQTSTPGIQVSGTGNSLTIYAQSTGDQMGQLEATGGWNAAGIGNGWGSPDPGSNITINGGTITATGSNEAAGIGSGKDGYCSNIAINGGTVEASGRYSGIGGWSWGSSDIFVATNLVIKAGDSAKDAQVIIKDAFGKLASKLQGKQYVTIEPLIATSYINEKGEAKTADAIEVNSIQGYWGAGNHTTWYVVTGENVTLSGAICAGKVNLILADGAKLTVNGGSSKAGIQVSGDGTSLTIYAQSTGDQMGQLEATGGSGGAGIGGGGGQPGSNITINGGTITATSGSNGAGIGGGSGGNGSNITINGGTITAISNDGDGAGIGGGNEGSGSYITINGGTVTATCDEESSWGAGIGGGNEGSGSDITINGGTVEATGGFFAAGIGGGSGGDGSNIFINGGTVTATGGEEDAAGIGGGEYGSGFNITISGGTVETTGGSNGAGIGGGSNSGSYITISGGTVTATGGDGAAGIGGGRGSGSDITISGGTVKATGGEGAAGIGGGLWNEGSNITISGGMVIATGGSYGAGIGSGWNSLYPGSNITISGGTVIANGGEDAAGIGNGYDGDDPASDIFVATSLVVKADGNNPPTTVIENDDTDLASKLAGKQYAIVVPTTYTRENLSNGKFGTICLAYAVDDLEGVGATFYKLNYFDESASALYLEEVTALEAGMPYIFEAKAESFTVTLTAAAPADADNENGLYGTLAEVVKTSDDIHSYAAISNNQVNVAENGNTVTVAANRAYIDMNEVATSEQPHSAPLRAIGVPRQTPTGNPSLHHSINSHTKGASLKIIEDGQFRIVREGKTYNAQGQIIQ